MTKTLKTSAMALVMGVFVLAIAFIAQAEITKQEPTQDNAVINYRFFATSTTDVQLATTTSATSTDNASYVDSNGKMDTGAVRIAGAEKVTFYFGRSAGTGGNQGQSRFEVEVSPDGSTWYDFKKLLINDGSNTATTSYTIVAATTTAQVSLDLSYHAFHSARCIVIETTDGKHTCSVTVEF